ncbi:hypothetical protein COO60DRAFT_1503530 [Scenedesmus sp. NREL 46B-D3]|nr:hypothetical protein COO60DRAFT_1503530 [Scenedesmus sp. NREL 46B-D3]
MVDLRFWCSFLQHTADFLAVVGPMSLVLLLSAWACGPTSVFGNRYLVFGTKTCICQHCFYPQREACIDPPATCSVTESYVKACACSNQRQGTTLSGPPAAAPSAALQESHSTAAAM